MRRTIVSWKRNLTGHSDAQSPNGENKRRAVPVVLLVLAGFIAPARAADDAPPIATTLIPVVAGVHGLGGVEWRTDVSLRNDGAADIDVALSLPTATNQPFALITLAGGESVNLADIVQQTFGQSETVSPLLVQTTGARPVSATAVIYPIIGGQQGKGEVIPAIFGEPLAGESQISALRLDANYRTNVGFVNLGTSDAHFTVALQRLEDRNMAIATIVVPAGGLAQMALQTLFPLVTEGSDLEVIADCGADQTYAYASIIRNDTSEAVFVAPLPVTYEP